jgi:SAM-dependent methyltransferase
MNDEQRRQSWSRYWASGALHSCTTSFAGNYDDDIGAFWRDAFSDLRASQCVLDVATGNGPLPKLIADLCMDLPEVDAVDLAEVHPDWHAGLPDSRRARIRFHAGVAAEKLPFADGSFDLIISQYGIEYSDLARSLTELRRVAGPQTRLAFVLHHAEALPVRIGRAELEHLAFLQASDGLMAAARQFLPLHAEGAGQGSPRAAFDAALKQVHQSAQSAFAADVLHETLVSVIKLAQAAPSLGAVAVEAQLAALAQHLADDELRQSELVAHALTRMQVEAMAAALAPETAFELRELRVRGELFGWGLRIR